jgi:hypothetical protein
VLFLFVPFLFVPFLFVPFLFVVVDNGLCVLRVIGCARDFGFLIWFELGLYFVVAKIN